NIGHRRHRGGFHGRVLANDALHLHSRDILTGSADDVFVAVDEIDPTLDIALYQIAGVKPTVRPGSRSGVCVLQVAIEKAPSRLGSSPAHQELGGLARRGL